MRIENEETKNNELLEYTVKQNSNKKQVEDKIFSIFKISELGYVVTGKTPSKDNPEDWGDLMPFITPSDYKNYRKYAIGSERMLSQQGVTRLSSKVLPPKSVLVTCIGSDMGRVVMNKCEVITNQQINSIIPFNNIVDNNFLYYSLVNLYDTLRVYGGDGSAVPILNKSNFENIEIYIPPLPEQRAIAAVLSSLDDKIDLLHRQNKTLEAMAETLFRQWFIEPCKNGLPEGWEITKIGNVLDIVLGGTPSTTKPEYWDGGIPWINSGEINKFRIDVPTRYITKLGLENSNTKLLPKGTTVIAITGATLGQISLLEIDACANQSVVGIIPNDIFYKEFVFFWVKYKLPELILNETGAAQPHINKNDVSEMELIIPPLEMLNSKKNFFVTFFDRISNNISQIRTLEKLRDLLLPKLISGEIRVQYE